MIIRIFNKHNYIMIILQFWIHPGTFYGICAPHKLPPSNCPLKRRLMIKLEILRLSKH